MAGTLIGVGLSIEGDVSSEEEIVVNGNLKGKLSTTDVVTVGESAVVQADLSGASMSVAGQVTGDVTAADRVDLHAGSRMVGDVKAARLTIADGASFKGNVDMEI
jgi:cytoskeletal protein CcmA (bactofilin family)